MRGKKSKFAGFLKKTRITYRKSGNRIAAMKKRLEKLYGKYNRRKYLNTDPVKFAHRYEKATDIETAAFLASALAYGNVKQINGSLESALGKMGDSPSSFLLKKRPFEIRKRFRFFRHRFTSGEELARFLANAGKILARYSSLENLFCNHYKNQNGNLLSAVRAFIAETDSERRTPSLLPSPNGKSPFKRFNLFLRWMIRKDEIDLGIWEKVSISKLIIPLDTHMRNISFKSGITRRKDISMKTALEITDFFRRINPDDPVKYDFALTRAGIIGNLDKNTSEAPPTGVGGFTLLRTMSSNSFKESPCLSAAAKHAT